MRGTEGVRFASLMQTCKLEHVVIREYITLVNIMGIIERSEDHQFNYVLLNPYDNVFRGQP
ncbi:hypothetical protein LCGC14_2171160 [marine sediment metagenome]|uniref:Uncharacterized protein n=1 Tax=marine sediment metagenome TaxID=412755 RepID=A0A0F9G2S1_9ZZZZ